MKRMAIGNLALLTDISRIVRDDTVTGYTRRFRLIYLLSRSQVTRDTVLICYVSRMF